MSKSDKKKSNRLPEWQSAKMKTILEERWSEVWETVVAREHSSENQV